jgi:DNA-binding CsgD family transcriptional regulator
VADSPNLLREILEGEPLTDRELEALQGAALDETAAETGRRLHLATDTIKGHRKRAAAKLGVRSVTRAVVVAVATGALNIADLVDD